MDEKSIFIEKLIEKLPEHYLCGENHTNYAMVTRCKTWLEIQQLMDEENWNFLGIATPPYNPYGEHLNFAFVIEDKNNDYEIYWHHVSDMWLDEIAKSLGIEYRFRQKNRAD